jgi:DNA primase
VAARISEQTIEQVRNANDVAEVIGSYFPLKRKGHDFWACCPFHKEKTPSFSVSPAKQIWYCFGCHAGGNVFNFIMQYENLEFLDAVRRLAERAGIRIEWEEAAGEPSRDLKDELLKLHDAVASFFHENLMKDKAAEPARAYLKKRKITSEIAKRWRLGYSPDSWDGLVRWAATRGFPVDLLETGGLVLPGDRGPYDRFRGRLMFPIGDEQGRVVGFSGRILTEAKDQPKYVNSPETPVFQKSRILFALDQARRSIIEKEHAIVCEGQLDTIACHEAGITNVVAPQGTALTDQHARVLKRYAEEVVLMFDADEAGQNAIVRSAEPLWEAGMALRVAVIPAGHDPDSFVKAHGPDKLKEIITNGRSFFLYLLERLSRRYNPETDHGKLQIVRQMAEWLVRIPSPIMLSSYVQQTATRLGVPEGAVRQELRKAQPKRRGASAPPSEESDRDSESSLAPVADGLPAELMLLQLMLADRTAVELVSERLRPEWLTETIAGRLIQQIQTLHSHGHWKDVKGLLTQTHDKAETQLLARLTVANQNVGGIQSAATDCLATLERKWIERRVSEIRKRLAQPDLPTNERDKLLRQALDLQVKLRNIPALSMSKPNPSGV